MQKITINKKYKVHDTLTLLKGYTGYIRDESPSYYGIYCDDVDKNVLVDKKAITIDQWIS